MLNVLEQAQVAAQQEDWSILNQCLQQLLQSHDLSSTTSEDCTDSSAALVKVLHLALEALESGDFQTRWEIAKVFSVLGTTNPNSDLDWIVTPLVAIAQEDEAEWELRWFAIRILGDFNCPKVIQALVELLQTDADDEDEDLSQIAAEVLASFGPAAIAPLAELLNHEASRLLAVQALAQIRHSETILPLLRVVDDPQATVRAMAIEALSSFHDARVPPILVQALSDPATPVRREAVAGLGMRPDLAEELHLVDLLSDRLWDLNLSVCQQAAIALGRIGSDAAASALFRVLQSSTTPEALELDLVRALGWMQTLTALDYLQQALPLVSATAYQEIVTALGRIDSSDLKPQVAHLLSDLLSSNQIATQPPQVKQAIALALGNLGVMQNLHPLVQLLADPDMGVQLHAIAALKKLAPQAAYDHLLGLNANPTIDPSLRQGIAIALQEWQIEHVS